MFSFGKILKSPSGEYPSRGLELKRYAIFTFKFDRIYESGLLFINMDIWFVLFFCLTQSLCSHFDFTAAGDTAWRDQLLNQWVTWMLNLPCRGLVVLRANEGTIETLVIKIGSEVRCLYQRKSYTGVFARYRQTFCIYRKCVVWWSFI